MSSNFTSNFYVAGGPVERGAPSYITRMADKELYSNLVAREYCHVLTSRQVGKTSIVVHTSEQLKKEGIAVAYLDPTPIGINATVEEWYHGMLNQIGQELDLEDQVEDYWTAHRDETSPLQCWMGAIHRVILKQIKEPIVIFIDEIDFLLSLPFSADEFFAGVRSFYNRRTDNADFKRLTFCLLGVLTPSDLIRDPGMTPFNVGRRVELSDFTEAEAAPLADGLGRDSQISLKLLNRIIYWTGGQPYLTQRFCQAVAEDRAISSLAEVDKVCNDLFLSPQAQKRDDNLAFVSRPFVRKQTLSQADRASILSDSDRVSLLTLYAQVRKYRGVKDKYSSPLLNFILGTYAWASGQLKVKDNDASPLISLLKLSGISKTSDGYLYVRNRVYYRVFDKEWVKANMPDAELQRQRRAYRMGQMRAAAVAAVIIALLTGSVTVAALRERNRAIEATHRADQNAEKVNTTNIRMQDVLNQLQVALGDATDQRDIATQKSKQAQQEQKKAEAQRLIAEQRSREAQAQRYKAEELRNVAEQQSAGDRADLFFAQGAYEKAEPLYIEYLDFLRKVYGPDHPNIPKVFSNLAAIYETQGSYLKAESFYQQALWKSRGQLGPQHPDTVRIMENYASLLRKLQRDDNARDLEALVTRIKSSGLTGALSGVIINKRTNKPIDRAGVQLTNLESKVPTATRTNADGNFFKDKLLPGYYMIRIFAAGFKVEEFRQTITAGEYSISPPVALDPEDNKEKPD